MVIVLFELDNGVGAGASNAPAKRTVRPPLDTIEIAKKVFQEIQNEFPRISMELIEEHEHVDLKLEIPEQDGIAHHVSLNLQGDLLQFSVSNFYDEWFPCTDSKVVAHFINAVIGYLRGDCRVLEYFKGDDARPYKAKLQASIEGNWTTVATWSRLSWPPVFLDRRPKRQLVVKNV